MLQFVTGTEDIPPQAKCSHLCKCEDCFCYWYVRIQDIVMWIYILYDELSWFGSI